MVAIASALIWAAIVVFIIFILRFVNLSTGFFPGVSSSNAPSPVSAPVSDNDGSGEGSPYTPMMDPVSGDDGGILKKYQHSLSDVEINWYDDVNVLNKISFYIMMIYVS